MKRTIATGTFDILHPGHLHYLNAAAAVGDELTVIVAHDANVTHKRGPFLTRHQRRDMVAALDPVDEAVIGDPEDVFVPLSDIDPDVVVLGHDQFHDEGELQTLLGEAGYDCEVTRAPPFEADGYLVSTSAILDRVVEAYDDPSSARTCPIGVRQQRRNSA